MTNQNAINLNHVPFQELMNGILLKQSETSLRLFCLRLELTEKRIEVIEDMLVNHKEMIELQSELIHSLTQRH